MAATNDLLNILADAARFRLIGYGFARDAAGAAAELATIKARAETEPEVAAWLRLHAKTLARIVAASLKQTATPETPATTLPLENKTATVRNLLYHVCPFAASTAWRKNVAQVMKRIDLFNGRRCVAISTGEGMADPAEVRAAFGGSGVIHHFIERPNSKTERERATFLPLLELVESIDPTEATFYAHAKGVATVGNAEGVMFWRNLMYHALLDDVELVRRSLAEFPTVGTHRKNRNVVYPDGIATSPWHFSGTYFWFRNADVFSRGWREALQPSGWGVEAWPGRMFAVEESACLAMENPVNPYDPATYTTRIADEDGPGTSAALKIEIGGGKFPRDGGFQKNGFLNVDKLDCADVQADFELLGDMAAGARLPFADNSVQHIYSSHCFEHVVNLKGLLHELARVAALGCVVEIRVPHWLSNMANCHDHKQTISHVQIEHWTSTALEYWWQGCNKRLKLLETTLVPAAAFGEWKTLLPHATDDQILRLCPDACHEYRFFMTFVPHGE